MRSNATPSPVATFSEVLTATLTSSSPMAEYLRSKDRLIIATDSSCSQSGDTKTAGILIACLEDAVAWSTTRVTAWRDRYGRPGKRPQRISYKEIRPDRHDLSYLNSFLRTANTIPGIVVTVSLPTTPEFIFSEINDTREHPELEVFRKWKPRPFESLLFLTTAMVSALAIVACPAHQVLWLSDHDEIVPNTDRKMQSVRWLAGLIQASLGFDLHPEVYVPTDLTNPLIWEDILAVPDIAAGGAGEYLERNATHYGSQGGGIWLGEPPGAKDKSREVIAWFGLPRNRLSFHCLSLDPIGKHAYNHRIALQPRLPQAT